MRRSKSWFLKNNELLADLPTDELNVLDAAAETLELRKKTQIWNSGEMANRIFLVRSGVVKVSKISDEGRELTLHFHTKDDLFGEAAALAHGAHESIAEAYEDVVLYGLPLPVLKEVMMRHPQLMFRISAIISQRRRKLENRIGALLFKTAHARLASLFLDLVESFGVRDSRGVIVNLKLTHKEMASLIGATRETVSFAILDLRRDGLIQTESKRVVILDEEGLRALIKA